MVARAGLVVFASFTLAACSVDEVTIGQPTPSPTTTSSISPALPRLAAGPHLGMITGFDALDAAQEQIAAERYAEARAAGMSIGRVQIDWAELETAPGTYDEQALDEAFADPNLAGVGLVVLISTLDSEGLTLPGHLLDNGMLRDGLTLASPEVTGAFVDLLDWLAPRLMARDVWLLSVGNEVRGPIEDGLVSEADAVQFYAMGLERWNGEVPEIGITVTFTTGAPDSIPDLFEAVRSRSDIAAFNYYCLFNDLTVSPESQWAADLTAMKNDAGDRNIFLQELGCPVGYSPQGRASAIGGSLNTQAAFFEYFGEQFATDPQLRAATLFQLFDWSPQLAQSFSQPLRDAGEGVIADRLEEWLATVGLVRWSDGTIRPAWQSWLSQLTKVSNARSSN